MLKAIAFGLCVGAGVQAFRNFPGDGPVSPDAAAVVLVVAVVCAYFGGRARRGAVSTSTAVASAQASSVATNSVQVAVLVPGSAGVGRHAAHGGVTVPDEAHPPSWLGAPVGQLELGSLDGADAAELAQVFEAERVD